MSNKNEIVSAFAFKTAKKIEKIISGRMGSIEAQNRNLQKLILQFWQTLRYSDRDININDIKAAYREHFKIEECRQ